MVTHRASYLNEVLSIRAQESEEYDTLFSGMTHLNEVLSIRAQECRARKQSADRPAYLNEVLSIRAQELRTAVANEGGLNQTSMKS